MVSGAAPTALPAALAVVVAALLASQCTEAFVGMNWGRQSVQRLLPSQVVDLMLQNDIRNVRIYSAEEDILMAFQNSGINLTITLKEGHTASMYWARRWVRWKYNYLKTAQVTSVIIGENTYPFDGVVDYDKLWSGLNLAQAALNEAGLGRMSTNFVHSSAILTNTSAKPSEAEFRPEIRDRMVEFLQHLRSNNAPFLVDFSPGGDLVRCGINPTFAFLDGSSKIIITDVNGANYHNGFLWQYDCFAWALEKVNASDIRVVVNTIEWATDGNAWASAANAEKFYKVLLPMVASSKGSPKRPGAPIDIFINALTDEPMMKVTTKPSLRHRGIYRSNGEPKYKIDLSGQGRNIFPTKVRGVMLMPERWCVFNGDAKNMTKVQAQMERACAVGDCTTLAPTASCGDLGYLKNVSYTFNVYFQSFFQDEEACVFEGLGLITDEDPSTETCVFPIEVVRGEQVLLDLQAKNTRRRIVKDNGVVLCVLYIMGLIVVSFLFFMFFDRYPDCYGTWRQKIFDCNYVGKTCTKLSKREYS